MAAGVKYASRVDGKCFRPILRLCFGHAGVAQYAGAVDQITHRTQLATDCGKGFCYAAVVGNVHIKACNGLRVVIL